ncbi:MAG: GntR family transcriptional regulator [Reyranellaceae bacterium]
MAVRRELGAPLYQQVFLMLREAIREGKYPIGTMLPSEAELCRMYRVSRITLRRSLSLLQQSGLIDRRQGSGTLVRRSAQPSVVFEMGGVIRDFTEFTFSTRPKTLEFDYVAPPMRIRALFDSDVGERMQRVVRLRSRGRVPLAQIETWVQLSVGERYTAEDTDKAPLTELMERSGTIMTSGRFTIGTTLADPIMADRLHTEVGAPLLKFSRVMYDQNGRVVQYAEMLLRPDHIQIVFPVHTEDLPRRSWLNVAPEVPPPRRR